MYLTISRINILYYSIIKATQLLTAYLRSKVSSVAQWHVKLTHDGWLG